jgi:hypothetical protein
MTRSVGVVGRKNAVRGLRLTIAALGTLPLSGIGQSEGRGQGRRLELLPSLRPDTANSH